MGVVDGGRRKPTCIEGGAEWREGPSELLFLSQEEAGLNLPITASCFIMDGPLHLVRGNEAWTTSTTI